MDHVSSPDLFGSNPEPSVPSGSVPISNGNEKSPYDIGHDSDGPVLPPPNQMQEEGFALPEWRRSDFIYVFVSLDWI